MYKEKWNIDLPNSLLVLTFRCLTIDDHDKALSNYDIGQYSNVHVHVSKIPIAITQGIICDRILENRPGPRLSHLASPIFKAILQPLKGTGSLIYG